MGVESHLLSSQSPQPLSPKMAYLHIVLLVAISAHLAHCSPGGASSFRSAPATKNIAELAIATPDLSPLLAAVKAADLVGTLSGPGPFTVFAPTNAAFAKIPSSALNGLLADKTALTKVLLRHVVPSVIKAEDIP